MKELMPDPILARPVKSLLSDMIGYCSGILTQTPRDRVNLPKAWREGGNESGSLIWFLFIF